MAVFTYLTKTLFRPVDFKKAAAKYLDAGSPDNDYEVADTTTLNADILSAKAAIKAGWPFTDQTAFDAAVDAQFANIATSVSTNVPNDNILISDVLTQVQTTLITEMTAGELADGGATPPIIEFPARSYTCPKCLGEGEYSKTKDTGDTNDELVMRSCNVCGGWGKTEEQVTYIQTYSNTEEPQTEG